MATGKTANQLLLLLLLLLLLSRDCFPLRQQYHTLISDDAVLFRVMYLYMYECMDVCTVCMNNIKLFPFVALYSIKVKFDDVSLDIQYVNNRHKVIVHCTGRKRERERVCVYRVRWR